MFYLYKINSEHTEFQMSILCKTFYEWPRYIFLDNGNYMSTTVKGLKWPQGESFPGCIKPTEIRCISADPIQGPIWYLYNKAKTQDECCDYTVLYSYISGHFALLPSLWLSALY